MDQLDQAKQFEQLRRSIALKAQKQNRLPQEPPIFNSESQIICIDCKLVIPPERIEARPESVRCVSCKTDLEMRNQ